MKRAAFYLVAGVITVQLLIVSGVLAACFKTGSEKCTGDRAGELLMYITAQSFALYASEK
tara:strand:+ start:1738 stop:1917 length:180 start_codon:yes stop_codon:yes gene_type:complete